MATPLQAAVLNARRRRKRRHAEAPPDVLAADGTFSTSTGWTAGSWVIGSGVATAAGATAEGLRDAHAGYVTGRVYVVEFDYVGVGICSVYVRGGAVRMASAGSGHKRLLVTAGASGTRGCEFYSSTAATLDNVTVVEDV